MRIWTLHPKYLDSRGLVALWRETLLAKHVLEGRTRGYTNHPQLLRFRNNADPLRAINYYLSEVYKESEKRGFSFRKDKFLNDLTSDKIKVTAGQLNYERRHLLMKLKIRDTDKYNYLLRAKRISVNPIFSVIPGKTEDWEKILIS